jgi:hypothetical protein
MSTTKTEALGTSQAPAANAPLPLARPNPAAHVPVGNRGIMLQSLDDLLKFAEMCVKEGAAPKGMERGAAAIAIQAGLEVGLGPLGGLRFGTVINGVFGWRGQGALALIQNSPVCKPGTLDHWAECEHGTRLPDPCSGCKKKSPGVQERKGICVAHRVGFAAPFRYEFSMADARKAHLDKKQGPWQEFTDGQLIWRAVGNMGRFRFSDVLGGFPMDFELRDHPEMTARVVSPQPERPALPPPINDPLNELIFGKKPETKEPVTIEVQPKAEPAKDASIEVEKQEVPPGAVDELSHEEADRELAEQERAEEEKRQRGLF